MYGNQTLMCEIIHICMNQTYWGLRRRCRTCGHEYKHPSVAKFHKVPPNQNFTPGNPGSQYLRNQEGTKVFEHCTVPEEDRLPGFPVPVGENMPRKKKSK